MNPCVVILDTNALLDWLVFKDPVAHALAHYLAQGQWRWLASPSMEEEWHQVWPRSVFTRWAPDPTLTQPAFSQAHMVEEPPRGHLKCKDPDDQVFIDLALQQSRIAQPVWLFSKDAALLKLARRARQHGVYITTLQHWHAQSSPALPVISLV